VEPKKPEKTPRERAEDLIRLLVPDWRPTAWQGLWAIRIVLAIVVGLGLLTVVGQSFGITLWDWLKLLVVPAVIAAGGLWFNRQQRERELEIAERRAKDEALQAYLDQMSDMLIPKMDQPSPSLYKARPGDSLSSVARARTLTVLPRLDGDRKARVVQFLYESGLIANGNPVIDLHGADLSGAHLFGAHLSRANLFGTFLSGAQLFQADLFGANLREANLSGADLLAAKLSEADLSGADLSGADLDRADLSGTMGVTNEGLEQRGVSLKGATMPNGQKYEDWLKDREDRKEDEKNE